MAVLTEGGASGRPQIGKGVVTDESDLIHSRLRRPPEDPTTVANL